MEIIEILLLAIKQKKQIRYEYDLPGRAIGTRIGNPHAIFISSTEKINIDIYKHNGVCSDLKPIPAWRQYTIKHIRNVVILDEEFTVAIGYNPISKQYNRVIAKI
jgi:hypothetical protein